MRRWLVFVLAVAVGCSAKQPDGNVESSVICSDTAQPPSFAAAPQLDGARSLETAPPPLAGGTLLALADGRTLVAGDPDRDVIDIVRLADGMLARSATLTLLRGDEPGRAAEDGAGKVHVALRRGGAIVDIDPASGALLSRRPVCAAPRGISYQPAGDLLLVACAGGELVSLPASGGGATRTLHLDDDLRDVVVIGSDVYVSRFRSAELLRLDADGAVVSRLRPGDFIENDGRNFIARVAWRTIAVNGQPLMLHQRGTTAPVDTKSISAGPADLGAIPPPMAPPSPYGGTPAPGGFVFDHCPSGAPIVHATISNLAMTPGLIAGGPPMDRAVVPLDLAVDPTGHYLAVAIAGAAHASPDAGIASVRIFSVEEVVRPIGACLQHLNTLLLQPLPDEVPGQAVAVAFLGDAIAVQSRKPVTVTLFQTRAPTLSLTLDSDTTDDIGHAIFHADSGTGIACASCHPEGGDDGRVWFLDDLFRRTQSLRGGLLATAPFHWSGDEKDFPRLFGDVFIRRMGGPVLTCAQVDALGAWIDRLPLLPHAPPVDAEAVARGKALFEDPAIECASCHTGPMLTNNQSFDVGTGEPGERFQVPSLRGLWARAPYLHDGSVATLRDRFTTSDAHGHTYQLPLSKIDDLIAYLESL